MVRKSLSILLALSILLGATFSVAVAQKPEPPQPFATLGAPPAIDMANLPAALAQAKALSESLSAEQQSAVRQILDKYSPELKEITELLTATPKSATGEQLQPVDKGIALRLEAMVKNIDAEMALVLNATQLSQYRAAVMPSLDEVQVSPEAASPKVGNSPEGTAGYTYYCEYCGYYDAYSKFYGYYGYLYAYYNYYYYGSGTYRYAAYYYSYYGYLYSHYALNYAGPTYFSFRYFNTYHQDYPYYSWYYSYYSEANWYWGYLYSYYDYTTGSGSTYAYYAQLYGYYGWYGAYYAKYYSNLCYTNA